jgi:hypothetical protein
MTRRSARSLYLRQLARETGGYYLRPEPPDALAPTAAEAPPAPSDASLRPPMLGRFGRSRRAVARVAAGVAWGDDEP